MKTAAWIAAAALAGLILAAGLRRRAPETPPPARVRPAQASIIAAASPAAKADPMRRTAERLAIRAEEVDAFISTARAVAGDLRRLQVQRQSEWSVEVDRQTRLEWEERYDADRAAVVARLERFLDGGERHREFLDQIETWAATAWAASQREYGKP